MRILTFALACGLSVGSLVTVARAGSASAAEPSSSAGPAQNACGCYEGAAGACICAKKNKCGCPGECEPAGCEEKRQKQLAKEQQEEIKQREQEDKKRNAELAKKREELDKKDAEKREKGGLRGLRLIEQK